MTMPNERTRAIIFAGDFLRELANSDLPKNIRDEALHILRHYPSRYEIAMMASQTKRHGLTTMLAPVDTAGSGK